MVTLLRHSAQVAAARQTTVGQKAQGPGAWGCPREKSACGPVRLVIKIDAALGSCNCTSSGDSQGLSHHLNISGRNTVMLGKWAPGMIRYPFGWPGRVRVLGWIALGQEFHLSVFSWLWSEWCMGTVQAENTVSSITLYVDTNLLIRRFALITGTLCLSPLAFLFTLMY